MSEQGKQMDPSDISEILFSKIKSNRMTDLTTNELLQSTYENCDANIQFIQKIIKLVNIENTILKQFIESEGLYGKFVNYAEVALDVLTEKVEIKRSKHKK